MSNDHLKSYAFRRERERTWRELEVLVAKTESGGVRSLTPNEVMRLPGLYRASLSSLSVARSISLDRNVLEYLEALAARAYFCVYGARSACPRRSPVSSGPGFHRQSARRDGTSPLPRCPWRSV